ncbi:CatB-related O-acetyltransferase [Phaeobacter sp. HF9A]|nr:CatB-related O-acetyltransferase [Phaeobacter sp. HF9A]
MPDADCIHPIILPDGTQHVGTVHLKNVVDLPNFNVGAYTYASDFDPPPRDGWASRLAPYLFPISRGGLMIGKFCQIAQGVRFITASANHDTRGVSTYPFRTFDPALREGYNPDIRDIEIGNDVWFGYGAQVMSGARIGDGAIIGAGAVVRGSVPPYAVVIGNPGTVIRRRFAPEQIEALLDIAWWDWPTELIEAHHEIIVSANVDALLKLAPE